MKVRGNTGKVNREAEALLAASRTVRKLREEVEEVRRQLRQLSQLDECRSALCRQEDALSDLVAGMVNMALALRQISDAYSTAEERSIGVLEEEKPPSKGTADVVLYSGLDSKLRQTIHQILYK